MQYTLKKSLGQHFLKDETVCRKIVEELTRCSFSQLLEVGPGGGALTKYLVQLRTIDFRAVEVDDEKVAYLKQQYPVLHDKIIHQKVCLFLKSFDGSFTVVGNFPYNISTEIVFKIIEWKENVQCMVGMFQKEVAQRLAAKEGSKVYGVTSVLTGAFFEVQYLFDVEPQAFIPPPKVNSAVIKLVPLPQPPSMRSEKALRLLVKSAFGQRRKTLRNACRGLFTPAVLENDIFNKRAEQLSVQDFASLTFLMQS